MTDAEIQEFWTIHYDAGETQKDYWRQTRRKVRLGLFFLVFAFPIQALGIGLSYVS